MTLGSVDLDEVEVATRFRITNLDNFERIRTQKPSRVIRKNGNGKKQGTPGSSRLRRNKHWSW
jgi:hypothetical protein